MSDSKQDKRALVWQEYYQNTGHKPHSVKAELAVQYDQTGLKAVVDCGCGTGNDIEYFIAQHYQVWAFDENPQAIALCSERFGDLGKVNLTRASFDDYQYPKASVVIASASLYFANPASFQRIWRNIIDCLVVGGVFVGDFLGVNDSWVDDAEIVVSAFTQHQVEALFDGFEIVKFKERDASGVTSSGDSKHWHSFTVLALKR